MATETHPLPKIALTAFAQLQQAANAEHNNLCAQSLDAMGLDPKDGWRVDHQQGVATRTVPDAAPEPTPES